MADGANPGPERKPIREKGMMRGMLSSLQTLLQRGVWARAAGLTFDGRRDLYEVFGYPKILTTTDYRMKYERGGIAKRVIEAPVDACWSDPPIITGSSRFKKAWDDIVTRQKVFYTFRRLDVLVGLGRFAVLLVGYDDGRPLSQAVGTGRKNVIYLQPYGEDAVSITAYDETPSSPRFGLPTVYEIQPGEVATLNKPIQVSAVPRDKIVVHWSRILHVAESGNENALIGHSRLEAVFNYLNDLEKIAGGSAEAYWLVANRGMHIDVDKEMDLDDDDEANLADEVEEYQHQLRRFIRTRGTTIKPLGADVTDPTGTFNVAINLISGTTGIPQRILLGSEAGQLASEQDRANWANRVQERVSNYASPIMLLPFIEMMIRNEAVPVPAEMTIDWPDAFKLSPLERGQASAQMARSVANVVKAMTAPIADDGSGLAQQDVSKPTTTPGQTTTDPVTGKTIKGQPTTTMTTTKLYKPSHTLLTTEEARSIVGFGKHVPVFDDSQDSQPSLMPANPKVNEADDDPIIPRPVGMRSMYTLTVKYERVK